jgi:multidrug efflux pump subunit AcrA (membrane-fusion protein)
MFKFCKFRPIVLVAVAMLASGSAFAQEAFVAKDAVLKIIESREIPSKASGVILRCDIKEGSLIEAGQRLVEIDDRLSQLNVKRLLQEQKIAAEEAATTVELEFMKRSIEVAKAELARSLQSNQRLPGAVPRSEIEKLQLMADRAVAEKEKTIFNMSIKSKQATIRQLEVEIGQQQLLDHKIDSPITGMVVELYKRRGEWVDSSQPIARIIQLDKLKTEIKVPASIALGDLVGTKATFLPKLKSLQDRQFAGKVIFVNPEANPVNSTMRVWVEIDNVDLQLVPGLIGSVRLERQKASKVDSGEKEITKR